MSEPSLGIAITEAVRLLRIIHRDAAALIATLDNQMAERGLEPLKRHHIGAVAPTINHPNRWLIDALYRGYVPAPKTERVRKLVAMLIEFEPPPPWQQPVCIVNTVLFTQAKARDEIWNRWDRESTHQTMPATNENSMTPVDVSTIGSGHLAGTSWCAASVVPLVELSSATAVLQRIVEPALASFPPEVPAD